MTAVEAARFGRASPDEFGDWYLVVALSGAFGLPAAAAATGYGIGRLVDRLLLGSRVNWAAADAAFVQWMGALEHQVLAGAHASLDERS
ncbi:hypothetical protein [Streptomyces katrae]|uniref:hypothetical protein n=1 Tax=Streptomyces katrae TaxID=68223 RepID=UPI0004C2884B|nr:hypothetical protein [Streptomyces katrae]